MKVFVAGATGVAGRRSVRALAAAGHSVTAVARSSEKVDLVRSLGATPIEINLFEPSGVRSAVEGHDAVVNLATKIPPIAKGMVPGAWDENNRIRSQVSKNLADACLASGVEHYIQESIGFMYPDGGDGWIDEDTPPDPPKFATSVLDAEAAANRVTEQGGVGVVLRFAQFYAPDAAHTTTWVGMAKRGLAPFLGPPTAYMPLVHAEDVGSAVVAALSVPAGTYNVGDDEPMTQSDIADTLAELLGVERLRFPPGPLAKLGGGKSNMLMRSERITNRRFRDASDWAPTFPNAREGLARVVPEIEARKS